MSRAQTLLPVMWPMRSRPRPYDDLDSLSDFAKSVDVITYEFENIPTSALDTLEEHRPIRPGRRALSVSQDRLIEKSFLRDLGLLTAPYAAVDDATDLAEAIDEIGTPGNPEDQAARLRRQGPDPVGVTR